MTTETIIKDDRGTIRIVVDLWTSKHFADASGSHFRYDVTVWHTPPKKRKETNNPGIAKPEEIWGAKMKLWSTIKP